MVKTSDSDCEWPKLLCPILKSLRLARWLALQLRSSVSVSSAHQWPLAGGRRTASPCVSSPYLENAKIQLYFIRNNSNCLYLKPFDIYIYIYLIICLLHILFFSGWPPLPVVTAVTALPAVWTTSSQSTPCSNSINFPWQMHFSAKLHITYRRQKKALVKNVINEQRWAYKLNTSICCHTSFFRRQASL